MFLRCSGLALLAFLFVRCAQNERTPASATPPIANSKAQILNSIIVHEAGGLSVARAYLTTSDGSLLNRQNIVALNEPILFNLVISEGWLLKGGAVSIGAVQQIETAKGEPVLSSGDLFAQQPTIPAPKAGLIQLKTAITRVRADTRNFTVRYRVWDKNGPGEVAGSYSLVLDSASAR